MSADQMRRGNRFTTDLAYAERVKLFNSKFNFISKENDFLFIECSDCGLIFKRSLVCFKPSHRHLIQCPNCIEIIKAKRQREHFINIANAIIKKQNEKDERLNAYIESRKHICLRCGEYFEGPPGRKYCSAGCMKRQSDSNKEHRRRTRINNNIHDVISLPMLVKRDKGRCWLCGNKIDYSDHKVRDDGVFIVGKNYPSIDHVVALANGGTHTWNNVRLAHVQCNSTKRDLSFGEVEGGQIKIFC